MNLSSEQALFYRERVPAQFNRVFREQTSQSKKDPNAARILDEMRAVRHAIRVEVLEDSACHSHHLNIQDGQMSVAESCLRPPFFQLRHRLEDFSHLRTECGDSVLGFLGALAGLQSEMRLTAQRVRSLKELAGTLDFEVRGQHGFALQATFGREEPESPPRSAIRLEPEHFTALKSGQLDAQEAFLSEKIEVEGDLEMAVGAALAILAPD